jgi:uncharacterized membrane protein YfcA
VRDAAVILAAAFLAGIMNSIAGGGTLLSFPALVWIGRNPLLANATNAVALLPGSLAGMFGFRRDLERTPRWLFLLTLPSLLGGAAGAWLLLRTPARTFDALVPLLILGATLLFALQEVITGRRGRRAYTAGFAPPPPSVVPPPPFVAPPPSAASGRRGRRPHTGGCVVFVFALQLLIGVYGGYFGAGIGILMLAALGLIGLSDLHQMNGLKNLLAICMNGIAALWFALSGAVLWHDALLMALASVAGGYLGARMAHRFGERFVRAAVIGIGVVMGVVMMMRV